MMTVDIICAWCKKHIGRKDGFKTSAPSHGICPECASRELAVITTPDLPYPADERD